MDTSSEQTGKENWWVDGGWCAAVPKGVDGDEGQVLLALAQVVEGVGELDPVSCEEVDLLSLREQLTLHQVIVLLQQVVQYMDDCRIIVTNQ